VGSRALLLVVGCVAERERQRERQRERDRARERVLLSKDTATR